MSSSPSVLVVSRDQRLLQSRQLILGAFFEVDGAGRIQEAERLLCKRRFDLIVLCYSLSNFDLEQMAGLVEQQVPQPKVLTLSAARSKVIVTPTDRLHMLEAGPYHLLKRSAEILGIELKSKGRFIAA
jgi:DNA-binding response OmpR family regulator